MSAIDSGAAPTKETEEGARNHQTAFDQRFSEQSRTTYASGREAHKAHAQLVASGGTAPELLLGITANRAAERVVPRPVRTNTYMTITVPEYKHTWAEVPRPADRRRARGALRA